MKKDPKTEQIAQMLRDGHKPEEIRDQLEQELESSSSIASELHGVPLEDLISEDDLSITRVKPRDYTPDNYKDAEALYDDFQMELEDRVQS